MGRRIYFFTRIGGKHRVAPRLVDAFPLEGFTTYVEPFAGSAQVFLYMASQPQQPRSLSKIVLNDLDRDIYDMWKDVTRVSKERMESMPWEGNREFFYHLKENSSDEPHARLFRNLYLSYYSFSGDKSGGYATKPKTRGRNFLETLPLLQKALARKSIILNKDYREVMLKYDSPMTFFYIDPPYMGKEKLYEGNGVNPVELYEICCQLQGKFIMSYNRDERVEELFGRKFFLFGLDVPYISTITKAHVQELIITNYVPPTIVTPV
jgi:DNA adenine methylase